MLSDAQIGEIFVARWRIVTASWVKDGSRQVCATPLLRRYYFTGIGSGENGSTPYGVYTVNSTFRARDAEGPCLMSRYDYTISVRVNGDVETLATLSDSGDDPFDLEKKLHGSPWPWAAGYEWPEDVSFFGPASRSEASINLAPTLRNADDMLVSAFGIRFTLGFME